MTSTKAAYWCFVAAAMFSLIGGLILLTQPIPEELGQDSQLYAAVQRNRVIVGLVHIVSGVLLAVGAPQLCRRLLVPVALILAGVVAFSMVVGLLGPLALVLIFLLVAAIILSYRD